MWSRLWGPATAQTQTSLLRPIRKFGSIVDAFAACAAAGRGFPFIVCNSRGWGSEVQLRAQIAAEGAVTGYAAGEAHTLSGELASRRKLPPSQAECSPYHPGEVLLLHRRSCAATLGRRQPRLQRDRQRVDSGLWRACAARAGSRGQGLGSGAGALAGLRAVAAARGRDACGPATRQRLAAPRGGAEAVDHGRPGHLRDEQLPPWLWCW